MDFSTLPTSVETTKQGEAELRCIGWEVTKVVKGRKEYLQVKMWNQGKVSLEDVQDLSLLRRTGWGFRMGQRRATVEGSRQHGWTRSSAWVDGISISCFLVPRGRERSVDEEVGGFLWCVVGGRKQPYRWLLFSLKSAGRTAGRGRGGVRWETPVMMRREQADLTRSVV